MPDEYTVIDVSRGWMPDLIPFGIPQGGLAICKNLLPYDDCFMPMLDKVTYSSNAVSGTPLSAVEFSDDNGSYYVFAGTSTKLYRLGANKTFTDVTKLTTTYNAGNNGWAFDRYGSWIIATDYADSVQVLKGYATSNFVDLGGTPPKAKYVLFNSGHLILGYVNESSVISPKKIVWSALEDVENYTPSNITGADSQDLADADGEITGMANIGSAFGIWHKNSITMGYYAGAPYTFNLATNKVKNCGAIPNTIISIGDVAFAWGEKDIYYFDGSTVNSIGAGFRKTLLNSLSTAYWHRISRGHDTREGIIFWAYPSTASIDGTPDKLFCYNYRKNKASLIDIDTSCFFPVHLGGVDMDSLDSIYPDISDMPYDIDSNYWQSSSNVLACIDSSNSKIATLSGTALTGEIETGEMGDGENVFSIIGVRPRIQLPIVVPSVQIGYRMDESSGVNYTSAVNVNANGYAPVRARGKYQRIKMTAGQHSGIYDIKVKVADAGKR